MLNALIVKIQPNYRLNLQLRKLQKFAFWLFLLGPCYPLSAQLVMNEICPSNASLIADEDGDYEDWIELYNAGTTPVDLGGYFISDDASYPFQFVLPERVLEAGEFLLVFASGKNRANSQGEIHSNFSLSSSGEPVILTSPLAAEVDAIPAVGLGPDLSYGRQMDGSNNFYYFANPSPGESNNESTAFDSYLERPELLSPSGFYTSEFDLFVSHPDPEATLRYTLDGSLPDETSALYTTPITIVNRLGMADGISAIPTTSAFVPTWYRWYAPMAPVYKGTALRVRAFREGAIPSAVSSGTYIVDPLADERYDLPRVALVLPQTALFGSSGIYTNHNLTGINWEREASFELFDSEGVSSFKSDVGLRLHGGNSRRYALKSFRVYFRGSLGEDALTYPIFNQGDVHTHERILLRNSGSEWSRTYFRDAFAQSLLSDYADLDYMRYQPAITFVNGEYWGVLNIRERLDDNYIYNHHGYSREEIDMLEGTHTVVYGNGQDYLDLRNFWQIQDLSLPANWEHVSDRIHVDNFRDYHIIQIFSMNTDQPGKNVRFWKPKHEEGKWRWMLYDLDDSFAFGQHCNYDQNGLVYCSGLNTISSPNVNPASSTPAWAPNGPSQTMPLRAMLRSPFFQNDFINRFADLLNSAFLPERLEEIIDDFDGVIDPYMQEHYERWHRPEPSFRMEHLDLLRSFAAERKAVMEEHIVGFFELDGTYQLSVDVAPFGGGLVKVNSIPIHPDSIYIAGPGSYPWSGTYYSGVELPISAMPAHGFEFSHWLETGSTDDTLWVNSGEDITYTAVFEPINVPEPIHYWSFNEYNVLNAFFTVGGASLLAIGGMSTAFLLDEGQDFNSINARLGEEVGTHLRVNAPLNAVLQFSLPTSGYKFPVLSYEARRSGQGAGLHKISVSIDGDNFFLVDSVAIYDEAPQVYSFDFSALLGSTDNPDFKVKIEIHEGEGGIAGNNRLDNLSLDAMALEGDNQPPGIAQPLFRKELIAQSGPETVDLETLFIDPEDDSLIFNLSEPQGEAAVFYILDNDLHIHPVKAGEAEVILFVTDGVNGPVSLPIQVLVYPEAAVISPLSAFEFSAWDDDENQFNYPDHMLFMQGNTPDPGPETPLPFAYHIPLDDYHEDDAGTLGFPYNNARRTRINGLGEEGISFINTGRNRDVGAAVLALDLSLIEQPVFANWTAGTMMPNSKAYRLRLQYRSGITEGWSDMLSDGDLIEYERNPIPFHEAYFSGVALPESLLGDPYVQLRWKYYFTGEQVIPEVGSRSELRLDDIYIGTDDLTATNQSFENFGLSVYPNPTVDALHIYHEAPHALQAALYGPDGKCVKREVFDSQLNTLSLRDLSAGLFLLVLWDEQGMAARTRVVVLD